LGRNNKQLTTEQFIERAKKVHGDKYGYEKVNYINNKTKVIITCREHGDFKQKPKKHLTNNGCPKCANKLNSIRCKYTKEEFIIQSNKIHNNRYCYDRVKYKDIKTKVTITCLEHGDFEQLPTNHIMGIGCKKCGIINAHKNKSLTTEQFIAKAKSIHGNKYDYSLIKYKNIQSDILIICYKHGIFKQKPINHLHGNGCCVCNESHGENLIRKILEQNNIIFVQEKSFINLRGVGGGLLRFDFYLPEYNICIEFDGRQHFDKKYCNKYYGKEKLNYYEILKIHDHKKSRYCKNLGIKLIHIPYYQSKINEILSFNLLIKKVA
jgi:hypothetical protein